MSATSVTPIFDELVQLLGLELDLDAGSPATEPDAEVDAQAEVDSPEADAAA